MRESGTEITRQFEFTVRFYLRRRNSRNIAKWLQFAFIRESNVLNWIWRSRLWCTTSTPPSLPSTTFHLRLFFWSFEGAFLEICQCSTRGYHAICFLTGPSWSTYVSGGLQYQKPSRLWWNPQVKESQVGSTFLSHQSSNLGSKSVFFRVWIFRTGFAFRPCSSSILIVYCCRWLERIFVYTFW